MGHLGQMSERTFRRARNRLGSPVLTAVRPITDWADNLPAGYHYDEAVDSIHDYNGRPLAVLSDYWTTDSVDIVPLAASEELQALMVAGEVPAGSLEVVVLAANTTKMRAAWAALIDGIEYNIKSVTQYPPGSLAIFAGVRLAKR